MMGRRTVFPLALPVVLAVAGCGSDSSSEMPPSPGMAKAPSAAQVRASHHRAVRRRALVAARRAKHARFVAARRRHASQVRVEAEAEAQAAAEDSASEETSSECDPNYSGACLSPTASATTAPAVAATAPSTPAP
jgi:hypothetical protein